MAPLFVFVELYISHHFIRVNAWVACPLMRFSASAS